MTFDPSTMHITRRPSILPGLMALFVMCGLIFSLGVWLFLPDLIRVTVQRLMPPAYPGVEILDRSERLEFGTATEEITFHSREQVYAVRSWMEQRMPGFKTCESDTTYLPDCSSNIVCDSSFISKGLIWMLVGQDNHNSQACVSVLIRAEPGDESTTLIRYTVIWPAVEEQTQ